MADNAKFKTLTCLQGQLGQDPLLDEIAREVQASSVLEVMKAYSDELRGRMDNKARPFQKMVRLLEAGITPTRVEGHYDGEVLVLRTRDEDELLARYGNFIGFLWGEVAGPVAPWVGKTFTKVPADLIRNYTEGFERSAIPTYLGTNHFEKPENSVIDKLSDSAVTFWMHLKDAPQGEKSLFGYDKNGGLLIARCAESVHAGTEREVFQLNYRWHDLGNFPPISHLIEELVQIADGVYLGQLLFATKNVLGRFDPRLKAADYGYQHFGYFLLMDDSWAAETRRVFPNIKSAPPTRGAGWGDPENPNEP
jgi:hypothetical protein